MRFEVTRPVGTAEDNQVTDRIMQGTYMNRGKGKTVEELPPPMSVLTT